MEHRNSFSSFFSSVNHGSNVNNLGLAQHNVDSVNASGHGNSSSSIGWMGQSSSIGSSHDQVDPEELNAEHGWLPSPVINIETSESSEEVYSEPDSDEILSTGWVSLGPSPSQSATSDAVPQKLDLNVAHEDNNGNIRQEIGTGYLNRTSRLAGNTGTFERNTRRRTNPANEQDFPFSNVSPSVHVGSTSQILQPSYWMTNPSSSSVSSISPVIPASGSNALWQEENSQYIARSTSVQSVLVPGTERGNPGQNVIPSRAFPRNYSSQNGTTADQLPAPPGFPQHNVTRGFQNGFTGGVHLSSTPRFPPLSMAEEYAERLSHIVNSSMTRLSGLGSGGQIGHHLPPSNTSVTMRGMLDPRPANLRTLQALPRSRVLTTRAEGSNAAVPPILPTLEQLLTAQQRARLVHRALEILQWVDGTALQFENGMIVGPMFYEPDVHEDMRLDVDNMSYEELLALEEQIGNVSTGLSEEAILGVMKQHTYQSMKLGLPVEEEPCCVCQEEYVDGEALGKLDCGHEFHFNCIKQWLMQKNACPICKKAALAV